MTELEDARELLRTLHQIKLLKKQIFGDTQTLENYCFACGKYLGSFQISSDSVATFNISPLCNECFRKKIGKMADIKLIHR